MSTTNTDRSMALKTETNVSPDKNDDSEMKVGGEDYWMEEIGPEELQEYREMLMNLGFYPVSKCAL